MGWAILFFLMTLWGTGIEIEAASQGDQSLALLEQRYDRETNPRRQAGIALELTRHRLQQLRAAYDAENAERWEAALESYRGALERLGSAVAAASHGGTSKNAEMHLRRQGRDLENLKTSVAYFDRPAVEKLIAQASDLRQQILYSIMNPPKRK